MVDETTGIADALHVRAADRVSVLGDERHLVDARPTEPRGDRQLLTRRRLCAADVDGHVRIGGDDPRRHRRHVRDLRVVPVEEVVDRELPVAVDDELLDAGDDLDVPPQRDQVDAQPAGRAEVVLEPRGRRVERREDEAVVALELRDLAKAKLAHVEIALVELVDPGDADEVPADVVRPPVVRAHEGLGVAFVGSAHRVAAVHARVQEAPDAAVLLPDREDVVEPHGRLDEVARLGDLRLVAEELPRSAEDELHLGIEDVGIAEDPAVDLTTLDRHETLDVERFGDRHDRTISRDAAPRRHPRSLR